MNVFRRVLPKPPTIDECVERVFGLWPAGRTAGRPAGLKQPLIFFVHVPKTAGSTVNAILRESMPDGFSHCEAFIHDAQKLFSVADSCRWLSGHVDLDTAETMLARATGRAVRYFACMRNPTDHVRSHYNWLIEIFHRGGDFYEPAPPKIKTISETIRSSSKDAASVLANLDRFAGLLLNAQSTYILGHAFDWSAGALDRRLGRYEAIVDSNEVHVVLSRMVDRSVRKERRENASTYHFDPAIFDTDEMTDFLKTRNARDETLYRALGFQLKGVR